MLRPEPCSRHDVPVGQLSGNQRLGCGHCAKIVNNLERRWKKQAGFGLSLVFVTAVLQALLINNYYGFLLWRDMPHV